MVIAEIIGLGFYALQQLGVALGVGGQTAALLSRNHPALMAASRKTAAWGLWGIIVSGVFITAAHVVAGEGTTVAEPAYLFKWLLVLTLLIGGFMTRGLTHGILVGGSWYALFLLHTVAPVTSFPLLLVIYTGWMLLFGLVLFVLDKKPSASFPEERVTAFEEPVREAPSHMPAFSTTPTVYAVEGPLHSAPLPLRTSPLSPLPPAVAARPIPPPTSRPVAALSSVPPNLPMMPQPEPRRTSGIPQAAPSLKTMLDAAGVEKTGMAPAAFQSIPTVLPQKDSKPLSAVNVMPRSPNDLKK